MSTTLGSSEAVAIQPVNGGIVASHGFTQSLRVWRKPEVRETPRRGLTFLPAKELAHAIAAKLGGNVESTRRGWKCRCPAHADDVPSLNLEDGKSGKVLATCFVCGNDQTAQRSVVAAITDLGYALSPPHDFHSADTSRPKKKIVAVNDYVDALGKLVFQVVRYWPKDFKQRRPDGSGGFIWDTKGCPVLPYRLPDVLEAVSTGGVVFAVEGEKDVDTAFRVGLVATTNARGAGKWTDEHSECLRGADVVLIPDNNQPGRDHITKVARSLRGKASRIRRVELPGVKDLSDWIAAGHTADELMRLIEAAEPWDPDASVKPAPMPLQVAKEEPKKSDERRTQATTLIEISTRKGIELFHAPMGRPNLRNEDRNVPVKLVTASRGKAVRAEPIATLYARGEVDHSATFAELEQQATEMTTAGFMGQRSPDRLDAMVWALSELSGVGKTIEIIGVF